MMKSMFSIVVTMFILAFSANDVMAQDECAGAVTLTPGPTCVGTAGSNVGATQSIPAITCGIFTSSSALDVWYKFTATATSHTITVVGGATFDAIIDVRSGACPGTNIACADATTSGGTETVTVGGLTVGQIYLVRVYGWAGGTGTFTICVTGAPVGPSNDDCASATTLTSAVSCSPTAGTNVNATQSIAPITCATFTSSSALDVWYKFTATGTTHTVTVVGGTGFDAIIDVRSGACNGTNIGCADATTGGGTEVVTLTTLTIGQVYLVRVYAWAGGTGTFTICVTNPAPVAPSNNECATATVLTPGASCTPTAGTTVNATQSIPAITCATFTGTADDDVWYQFTATSTNHNVTVVGGAGFDAVVDVRSGACNGTNIGCADATVSAGTETVSLTGLTVGATYLVRVYSFSALASAQGTFTICVTTPVTGPANNDCATATTLIPGATCVPTAGTTVGATQSIPAITCATFTGTADDDVWYQFTATSTTHVVTVVGGAGFDAVVDVRSGACNGTNIGCADATVSAGTETVNLTGLTVGATYLVRVYSFSALASAQGTFTICVTTPSTGPANNECATATTLTPGTTCVPTAGTTVGASQSIPAITCATFTGTADDDVWYQFTATAASHTVTVVGGTGFDAVVDVRSGACNGTNIGCADATVSAGTETVNLTGLTVGTTYLVRVYSFGSSASAQGTFNICVTTPPPCVASPTSPTNGQTNICPSATTTLSWPTSAGATGYDVYFGTTATPPFVGTTASTSFVVNTPTAGTYFWQIRPVGPGGTAPGCTIWSFTKVSGAFTVPAFGASQVACPSQIVQPAAPPSVTTNCGTTVTPTGPTITNNPATITCEGTRTFTWTYNNGFGQVSTWNHVVTVERNPFSVPANGSATVSCPAQTSTQPVPPTVTSNCGETLTPVVTSSPIPGCEGNRVWSFTYTDCEGNTATWLFTYTVETLDFSVPASVTTTIGCPLGITLPTPPTVMDNCGNLLNPVGPSITSTNNTNGCEGSRKYSYVYTDCEGNTHTWSSTFNFNYPGDFFVYPDGEDFVGCLLYAQTGPVPPDIYGACGELIGYSGPVITESVDASGCSGTRKFTFIYTDCGGHSHPWSFTYHAADNEPPVGDCSANANVTNLSCIEDVPCPDNFDFGPKIHELLATGNIYDVCSGSDLVVELDSWSELWQCSDPDGDGVNTFGRTFYFRIADQCGNEMPSLCGITYSGLCQPLETFNQTEWGNEGGEPAVSTPAISDAQAIQTLLDMGPFKIGGSNRSITLTNAACVQALVPGVGNPAILGNCNQTDCTSGCNPAGPIGMKNTLATNTISLLLNMRFNVQYHNLAMANIRNQGLGCIAIDQNIKVCDENGSCKLRVFESDGTVHQYPYNLGGLLDLANLYLNGALNLTDGVTYVYASAINKSVANANAYWHNGQTTTTCNQSAGSADAKASDSAAKANTGIGTKLRDGQGFSLAPNPASTEINFKLAEMPEAREVTLEVYNQLGQVVLQADYGKVAYVNERIDLSGIDNGLYVVRVMAGGLHYEQKLVIAKQ